MTSNENELIEKIEEIEDLLDLYQNLLTDENIMNDDVFLYILSL